MKKKIFLFLGGMVLFFPYASHAQQKILADGTVMFDVLGVNAAYSKNAGASSRSQEIVVGGPVVGHFEDEQGISKSTGKVDVLVLGEAGEEFFGYMTEDKNKNSLQGIATGNIALLLCRDITKGKDGVTQGNCATILAKKSKRENHEPVYVNDSLMKKLKGTK